MTMPDMPVKEIIKRNGSRVPFDAVHISVAITKAGAATGEFDEADEALVVEPWHDRPQG